MLPSPRNPVQVAAVVVATAAVVAAATVAAAVIAVAAVVAAATKAAVAAAVIAVAAAVVVVVDAGNPAFPASRETLKYKNARSPSRETGRFFLNQGGGGF